MKISVHNGNVLLALKICAHSFTVDVDGVCENVVKY